MKSVVVSFSDPVQSLSIGLLINDGLMCIEGYQTVFAGVSDSLSVPEDGLIAYKISGVDFVSQNL